MITFSVASIAVANTTTFIHENIWPCDTRIIKLLIVVHTIAIIAFTIEIEKFIYIAIPGALVLITIFWIVIVKVLK